MSNIPKLKDIVLRDTPFAQLMKRRIYNVLLIATKYDAFMLEDDGRVDELIFNEYTSLSLRYPPRFTRVTTEEEALVELASRNFELVIVMPNMAGTDVFAAARNIKHLHPTIAIVVLTPFSREVSRRVEGEDLTGIDYVFSWLGNAELLMAIIKLIEDKWNAPQDSASVGVQIILLVEDSIRFYSSALAHLYRFVLEQSKEFSKEALNDHLKTMRMRGRPKVMLARTYEEAIEIYETYSDNILGVISDMSFKREGCKDPMAGYRLAKRFREHDPRLPIILESSEEAGRACAAELNAAFISKHSKSYPQDLRREIMSGFGFGDFIIINPQTGREIMRIRNLKDLQTHLREIPDDSLRYHLSHDHFSRFFFSRAMFPPAMILKKVDVSEYAHMDEARELISDCIIGYRKMKNTGVVAIYQRGRFDEYGSFARIGNGSLGGKGRGLAFMGTMVSRYPRLGTDNFTVGIPKTVVLCTDIFDEFMESNHLYPIALSDSPDPEILQAFLDATLPQHVIDDLTALLEVVHGPIAVRSSSLLEDSHYQPFAGVYATYMIPKPNDRSQMMDLLRSAIKSVYASVFYRDSKAYLTATQNLIDQEKMAVVLQEVIGSPHTASVPVAGRGLQELTTFYPTLSGVGRSLNFYPIGEEKPEEGIVNLAFGLGKYLVDGGRTLRFSPAHPHHILQLSSPEYALRETQTRFVALDLTNLPTDFRVDDGFNLLTLPVRSANVHGTLQYVASTFEIDTETILPGWTGKGRAIISFDRILQAEVFPLAETISELLRIGSREMGRPVEIEFAMDIRPANDGTPPQAGFYLLQIRPIVDSNARVEEDVASIPESDCLVKSTEMLGNGKATDICDIIYIRPETFNPLHTPAIAAEMDQFNRRFPADSSGYILIGPGRWGSSDPSLGIPVSWSNICMARAIVETSLDGYRIDPSQGTHFFQNLTSFGVGYFTVAPHRGQGFVDFQWLDSQPAVYETRYIRHLRLNAPLTLLMDGRHSCGAILRPARSVQEQ